MDAPLQVSLSITWVCGAASSYLYYDYKLLIAELATGTAQTSSHPARLQY